MKSLARLTPNVLGNHALPHRQAWHNLGAYASSPQAVAAWQKLRAHEAQVDSTIVAHFGKPEKRTDVDKAAEKIPWELWEKKIAHKEIVHCMKSFYEHQSALLDSLAASNHNEFMSLQTRGWELFDSAVSDCEKAVETSENLVANGARGLWVSYNNPPLTKVDDNEWLDSDRHWQAVVQRQFLYNPTASAAEEELPAWKEVLRDGWRYKMETFNARSDTPVLYQYMDQLPSWEYYDIHRRAFLEHMAYYLIRTGEDYRMFPECPPWKWLAHIEQLRYQFIQVAQRRRRHFQMSGELRELPLDVQPLNADHEGDAFHANLVQRETSLWEHLVARLMGSYCFLTHPYIPVRTQSSLYRALGKHGGGKLYNIGEDVSALFFLPDAPNRTLPSPREAFQAMLDHSTMRGIRLNPGYATLMDIHTQILEERGDNWLMASGELLCDAFMRRLQREDPAYHIYALYVQELKERFETRTEIAKEKMFEAMEKVEAAYRQERELYPHVQHLMDLHTVEEASKEYARIQALSERGELEQLLNEGALTAVALDSSGKYVNVKGAAEILRTFAEFAETKQHLVDAIKAEKLPAALIEPEASGQTIVKDKSRSSGERRDFTDGSPDMHHLESHLRGLADK